MSFINDESVVRVKLTNKGRELLSRGKLTFKKFAIGDSEIDYNFMAESGVPISETSILRPKDRNPSITSFIYSTDSGTTINNLPSVSSIPSTIINSTTERGFFTLNEDNNTYTLKNDVQFMKQFDCKFILSECDGGKTINLYKSNTYLVNNAEPVIGDYILVKWMSPVTTGSTVGDFAIDTNTPYLWYKIQDSTGSLTANNLIVTLDRDLPNFSGSTNSSGSEVQVMVFPNSNNREINGDSVNNYYGRPYITDFVSQSTLAFFENSVPVVDVPIWNMHIVYTKEIAGVDVSNIKYHSLKSKNYSGFVSYIQNQSKVYDNLGIIHYTNLSPSNHYGESFVESTPVLELPTIMWHKNNSIGITLSCDITKKYLNNLNIFYYDLIENNGNVVGKVFNDLKLFIIEDQELLMAMSYKSNRNWTLPKISGGLNIIKCD